MRREKQQTTILFIVQYEAEKKEQLENKPTIDLLQEENHTGHNMVGFAAKECF